MKKKTKNKISNSKCINLKSIKRCHNKNSKYGTKKIKKNNTLNEPKSSKTKRFIQLNTTSKKYKKKLKK